MSQFQHIPQRYQKNSIEQRLSMIGLIFGIIFFSNQYAAEMRSHEILAKINRVVTDVLANSDKSPSSHNSMIEFSESIRPTPQWIARASNDLYHILGQYDTFQTDYALITFHRITREDDPNAPKDRYLVSIDLSVKNTRSVDPRGSHYGAITLGNLPIWLEHSSDDKPHLTAESSKHLREAVFPGRMKRATIIISIEKGQHEYYLRFEADKSMFQLEDDATERRYWQESQKQSYLRFLIHSEAITDINRNIETPRVILSSKEATIIDPWQESHIYEIQKPETSVLIGQTKMTFHKIYRMKASPPLNAAYNNASTYVLLSFDMSVKNMNQHSMASQDIHDLNGSLRLGLTAFNVKNASGTSGDINRVGSEHQTISNQDLNKLMQPLNPGRNTRFKLIFTVERDTGYYLLFMPDPLMFQDRSIQEFYQNRPEPIIFFISNSFFLS
ncbi:hypothetical protein PVA45_07490 (plasmid) [Entomospira entomophila]|uniref:Uncharacterized protein n=1 Tax=Entomospira entomophila TaxID=2719988 RepID=A0A968KTC7_9SPIO|nr:hypothetical protein [Entomospira entomophilus]NIZ41297.1 hypothetical protein [Entomospira entomophilus]WDI36180.1 hypothetical protein PVA45_07490 [Entomospira entomophilus]